MARRRKLGPPEIGHVVEEYYIGHTHIRICDDAYRGMTPEDVQKHLDYMAKKHFPAYMRALALEAEKKKKEEEERANCAEENTKEQE